MQVSDWNCTASIGQLIRVVASKYHARLPGNYHVKFMFLSPLSSFWSGKQVQWELSNASSLLFLAMSQNLSRCEEVQLSREQPVLVLTKSTHTRWVLLTPCCHPGGSRTPCTSPSCTVKRSSKDFYCLETLQSSQNTLLVLLWHIRTKLPLVSTGSSSTNDIKAEKQVIRELPQSSF